MHFERSSGVLLHVSSLPSRGPIGDLGPAAYEFLDFLAAAQQHVWQVLPLSSTGYGNSPYAATSAFAGNPYLVSAEVLRDWGWIDSERLEELPPAAGKVDFKASCSVKMSMLDVAARYFLEHGPHDEALAAQWAEYEEFCRREAFWLDDYACFDELSVGLGTRAWPEWYDRARLHKDDALECLKRFHGDAVDAVKVLQFAFDKQWRNLRQAAAERSIRILGDVAIFVSMDSADVWQRPELFELDEKFQPVRVAGVPPDYFSATGQRWGNPLYRWDVIAEQGYAWWIERMRRARELYDIVRLDHFRGFEAYWAIPVAEKTAVKGEWVKGPGEELFRALEAALGPLPLVAEDLGLITPEVDALRHALGLPGMKVLQFGFSDRGAHIHLPPHATPDTVAYTGTHDNDTTEGWWRTASQTERAAVEALVGSVADRPVWPLIRATSASVAEMAIFPAQDLLELGSEARMNTPAVAGGNWEWRAPAGAWTPELAARLKAIAEVTDRNGDPLAAVKDKEAQA